MTFQVIRNNKPQEQGCIGLQRGNNRNCFAWLDAEACELFGNHADFYVERLGGDSVSIAGNYE